MLQNIIRIYNLVRLFTLLPDFCEKFSLLFHFCRGFANDKMLSLFKLMLAFCSFQKGVMFPVRRLPAIAYGGREGIFGTFFRILLASHV